MLLAIVLFSSPSPITAQEEFQNWSGSAEAGSGLILNLLGPGLVNGRIAVTEAEADNVSNPRSRARGSQLGGGLFGLSINFAESIQTTPPNNPNPVSDQLLTLALPLIGGLGVTETEAHARWPDEVADAICTTGEIVLSRASVLTADAQLGSIRVDLIPPLVSVDYDVLSYEDGISNESVVILKEAAGDVSQQRAIIAESTSTLGDISLLNDLVTIEVNGAAHIIATATGEPGGASIEYTPPDLVRVDADLPGFPRDLIPGQSVELSLLGLFSVTVGLGEPTSVVEEADGTEAGARVPVLTAQVELLGAPVLDAVLSELSVNASVPEGGIACAADPAEPVITGLSPSEGPVSGGTTVTVFGDHFIAGETSVTIGGVTIPAVEVSVGSPTELTFVTPGAAAPGPVQVTVTTPGGTSDPLDFTYTAVSPVVTDLNPDHGPVTGGTAVTVTGDYFIDGETFVTIGAVTIPAEQVTVNSSTELTYETPAVPLPGTVQVAVTTPGGTSDPLNFTYTAVAPIADNLDPNEGPVTGGNTVTVTGAHFIPGDTSVTIGGITIPAAEVTVISPDELTFVTPAAAAPGPVEVTVTTPGGTSDPLTFTYTGSISGDGGNGSAGTVRRSEGFTLRIVPNVSSIPAGGEYSYTSIYTNRNQTAADNVVLSFTLPGLLQGITNGDGNDDGPATNATTDYHYDQTANQVMFQLQKVEPGHGGTFPSR